MLGNRRLCLAAFAVSAALLPPMPALSSSPGVGAQDVLGDPTRPDEERERDAGSRPLEVYDWLGVRSGSVVVDLIPYFGYNSHLLARVVGPTGRVLAVGSNDDMATALRQRFDRAGIANAEVHLAPHSVPDTSVDIVISVRNVHDMFIPEMVAQYGMERTEIFAQVLRILRPGGIFGVIDARTPAAGVDAVAHRINENTVVAELRAAGFDLIDRSDLLGSAADDADGFGDTRWAIDRFLLKFRKPG